MTVGHRSRLSILVPLAYLGALLAEPPAHAADLRRPLDVVETIEMKQILGAPGAPESIRLSPDGRRWFVAVTQGDLRRNGTWMELIAGRTTSLEQARPETVARLFTANTGLYRPTHAGMNSIM